MDGRFTVDGIIFSIKTTRDDDISFILPDHMGEEVRLSVASANLLTVALMTAIADLEEDD